MRCTQHACIAEHDTIQSFVYKLASLMLVPCIPTGLHTGPMLGPEGFDVLLGSADYAALRDRKLLVAQCAGVAF